ncbi:unnamed protein product [Blepharisma stoltei]|uniref:Uncharacterized protein n=1 Tax=Blepharisma stoltei TaxID=1481888 RepID=A0AAU9ITG8_9CILI|nr:unnamed protein product [Blepharisma stoltei]
MTLELEITKLEQGLHDLFKYAFITNCELDDEAITSEEEKTLEELDPLEVLENLKDVVLSLLKFKKTHKNSESSELMSRSEQFEKMLQKLEGDIRNHIKIEHQLKLHIEATQAKIEELEANIEKSNSVIKKLEKKQEKNMHDVYNKSIDKSFKTDTRKKDNDTRLSIDKDENWEEMFHKLEKEFAKMKGMLEEKQKECDIYKKESAKSQEKSQGRVKRNEDIHDIEVLRKRLIEKGSELTKLQQKLKDKSYSKLLFMRERASRNARRSLGEVDMIKSYSPNLIRKETVTVDPSYKRDDIKMNVLKKARSSSRGHSRSFSEQNRPKPIKRAPSR